MLLQTFSKYISKTLDKRIQAPDTQGLSHYVLSRLDTKASPREKPPSTRFKKGFLTIPKAA